MMFTKFETKSDKVKGLSFHSKRPWILASLYSGVIQLWDYRMGTLINRFDAHHGPVRGVHFHKTRELFVSGGDDCEIKVWNNYKSPKCWFTLLGHLDYIRTVQFHHKLPLIVSASDDHTIRIWNWMSRSCLSVLTGHSQYVMCASFHPNQALVVSASMDQTVRVWDIGVSRENIPPRRYDILRLSRMNEDFFTGLGSVGKHVLKGHSRGVNWASFHPTRPLLVSGADDGQVIIWRMNGTKAWEVGSVSSHRNHVSCVLFHPKQDIIVSNSEDKSIQVWDTEMTGLWTFFREPDRFWILCAHPESNLLAAGHDSGMIVFQLERERPAFCVSGDSLLYVKDCFLRVFEYSTEEDGEWIPIRRPGSNNLNQGPCRLSYSPTKDAALICSDMDGGSYELYTVPKESDDKGHTVQDAKRGIGGSAVFTGQNTFAVLEKSSNQVLVKNLENKIVKKSALPIATDAIFYAGTENLLCRLEDRVFLFDLQQQTLLGDLQTPFVRYVVWSQDMENVALLSRHSIVIADKKLVHGCTLHEMNRVKSGAWDDNGVFIYTTLIHIKYCLPNGDSGIIKTLDVPVYITKIYKNKLFCLDRKGEICRVIIDSTEYILKLFLLKKEFDQAKSMSKESELCRKAMIAYLQERGFSKDALHSVKDECTRFNRALESGDIQVAVVSAEEIDEKDHWYKLGVEALRQGNTKVFAYACQKLKNFERLNAEVKNEVMGHFDNALHLCGIKKRVKSLENGGHLPLAYITASVHGLHDIAERLLEKIVQDGNL